MQPQPPNRPNQQPPSYPQPQPGIQAPSPSYSMPPVKKRKSRKKLIIILGIVALLLGLFIAIGTYGESLPQAKTTSAVTAAPTHEALQPTRAVKPTTAPTAKPTTITKLTAAQKQQVSDILNKNIQHYQALLAQGKQVLGNTQYADAQAGIVAFNDPNSAASRFGNWRATSNAERDVSYLDAFTQADKFYNADNEPAAISTWRDDMSTMQGDLATWVTIAVSWQIRDKTDADLSAAEAQFNQDIKQAQKDVADTLAAS